MKTAHDPRHLKRARMMQNIFSWDFQKEKKQEATLNPLVENLSRIDELIASAAPAWPIGKINKIDLAVLRQAVYELIIQKSSVPPKVVVDEAVELAKEFGGESSPSFVNGVLGRLIIDNHIIT